VGTLLTESLFNELSNARDTLIQQFGLDNVSGIHLPWAGNRLLNPTKGTRGLYYLGIATHNNYATNVAQNYKAALEYSKREWRVDPTGSQGTPFWQFLNGLTMSMYGQRYFDCIERWGWSNLFKIAHNTIKTPSKWPDGFFKTQRDASAAALRDELDQLKNAVIFIGSNETREMVCPVLPKAKWDTTYNDVGISFWRDNITGNIYIWGYHPGNARLKKYFDRMLERTLSLIAP
jgi:hypothetical protein